MLLQKSEKHNRCSVVVFFTEFMNTHEQQNLGVQGLQSC